MKSFRQVFNIVHSVYNVWWAGAGLRERDWARAGRDRTGGRANRWAGKPRNAAYTLQASDLAVRVERCMAVAVLRL